MKKTILALSAVLAVLSFPAQAQFSISPLVGFGGSEGWLAPGESSYLTTGNSERGLAFGNDHLYLVSRANVSGSSTNIRILNKLTGADIGGLITSGIGSAGATFQINTIAVGGDGAIYVNGLTVNSTTAALPVYRWASEGASPTVVYSGNGGLAGARVGDSLTIIGSGSSTMLALGFGSSPAVAGNNGYTLIDPTLGTATAIGFSGTPPNAGDFRLGISFADASHVLGAQGSSLYRYTSFSGSSGTLLASPTIPDPAGATADRLLAFGQVGNVPLLAMQSIGDSHVSIYDATDPSAPIWLMSANNTTAPSANANGTGQLAWGDVTYLGDGVYERTLYALSSNQGIQAFVVHVPEPNVVALAIMGLGTLLAIRRYRK